MWQQGFPVISAETSCSQALQPAKSSYSLTRVYLMVHPGEVAADK